MNKWQKELEFQHTTKTNTLPNIRLKHLFLDSVLSGRNSPLKKAPKCVQVNILPNNRPMGLQEKHQTCHRKIHVHAFSENKAACQLYKYRSDILSDVYTFHDILLKASNLSVP